MPEHAVRTGGHPGTFYMRESFRDQAALDAHFSMPYFKAFEKRFDELLARPCNWWA